MNRKKGLYILLIALVLLVLAYFYSSGSQSPIDWSENMEKRFMQPYGLKTTYELLKVHDQNSEFIDIEKHISEVLKDDSIGVNKNYIHIGENTHYDQDDLAALMEFVARGNKAFLFTLGFPAYVYDSLINDGHSTFRYSDEDGVEDPIGLYEIFNDSLTSIRLSHDTTHYWVGWLNHWKRKVSSWGYYSDMEEANILARGYIRDSLLNYFEVPYGEGSFFFHSTPLIFTNYYMLDSGYIQYADQVFSDLNPGDIYWDSYSKKSRTESTNGLKNRLRDPESPLKFILEHKALRWAWYILLTGTVLFILFYMKRRQRVIPVLEAKSNTTIDFIESIGELYLQQANHGKLVKHKRSLLLAHLRNHYNISLKGGEVDDAFIKRVSLKSGLSPEIIEDIFMCIKRLRFIGEVKDKDLIVLHQKLDNFYRKSK